MRRCVFTILLVALACRSSPPTAVPIAVPTGQSFDLAIGQSASVNGLAVTVRFLSVPEDSRCPVGSLVLCIWEGNAKVQLEVRQPGRVDTLGLNTTLDPKQVDVGTLRIQLTALNPGTEAGAPIPKSRYLASLIVTGRAD